MIAVVTYIKSRSLITAPVEQSAWIEPLFIGPVAFFGIRLRPAYSLLLWFRDCEAQRKLKRFDAMCFVLASEGKFIQINEDQSLWYLSKIDDPSCVAAQQVRCRGKCSERNVRRRGPSQAV